MGFLVSFEETVPYIDPEFGSLELKISGEADVSSAVWQGDKEGTDHARLIIRTAIAGTVTNISRDWKSYKEFAAMGDMIGEKIGNALRESKFEVNGIRVMEIVPSEISRRRMENLERLKAAAAMSPEEHAKRMMEAQRAAEETVARLTPEEKQMAEAEAKAMMQKLEQGSLSLDQIKDLAMGTAPKFCPNCGTPNKGTKFCPNCGNKL